MGWPLSFLGWEVQPIWGIVKVNNTVCFPHTPPFKADLSRSQGQAPWREL